MRNQATDHTTISAAGSGVAVSLTVPANRVAELALVSGKSYQNPYMEVALDAIVTPPDGNPLRVAKDQRHFEHADGTPFFWLGDTHGNQNVGLLHLADNGIAGMFRRTEYGDDVRDLFAAVGMLPLVGMLSTWGEDGNAAAAWRDSPLWYYQFLLAHHTLTYSWPGDWSKESVAHLRVFNDWPKNPRIQALLNAPLRPVYNGADRLKNDGPWCWMFTDEGKTQALVVAIDHLNLNQTNAFQARLGGLDATKTYLVEDITQTPDGKFVYAYRGEFAGARLRQDGLPIDLAAGDERRAAFWIQEKIADAPQVHYADAAVTRYVATGAAAGAALVVQLESAPKATAQMIVCKPMLKGVEIRTLTLDGAGRATASFDAASITLGVAATTAAITNNRGTRDAATAGAWHGKYGATAAWLAGHRIISRGASPAPQRSRPARPLASMRRCPRRSLTDNHR